MGQIEIKVTGDVSVIGELAEEMQVLSASMHWLCREIEDLREELEKKRESE